MSAYTDLQVIISQLRLLNESKYTIQAGSNFDTPSAKTVVKSGSRPPCDVGVFDLESRAQEVLRFWDKHYNGTDMKLKALGHAMRLRDVAELARPETHRGLVLALSDLVAELEPKAQSGMLPEKVEDKWLSANAASKLFTGLGQKVSHTTIRTWGKEGKVQTKKQGNTTVFALKDVANVLGNG